MTVVQLKHKVTPKVNSTDINVFVYVPVVDCSKTLAGHRC